MPPGRRPIAGISRLAATLATALVVGGATACSSVFATRGPGPTIEDFGSWEATRWAKGDHPLGLGRFDPSNVRIGDGVLSLHLPAGTYDGGEMRSVRTVGFGVFEARIRPADAAGSLTAFFLYEPVSGGSEVDIEILPDYRGHGPHVMFTTWVQGEETNNARIPAAELPVEFDVAAFHTYRIETSPESIRFYIDGVFVQEFTEGIPDARMHVRVNAWWPSWLEGADDHSGARAEIDWIRICGSCSISGDEESRATNR